MYGGLCKAILPSPSFDIPLLTCGSNTQTNTNVIVKSAPVSLLRNERKMLTRFRDVPTLRRLVDEVQDPPLLVLEYLDSNTLAESRMKGFKSSDAKLVAKAVLETLAAFHAEGIVDTGR